MAKRNNKKKTPGKKNNKRSIQILKLRKNTLKNKKYLNIMNSKRKSSNEIIIVDFD